MNLLEKIIKQIEINNNIDTKMKELELERENSLIEIIQEMVPYLNDIYSNWRPKIGESVVHVDFGEMIAYELNVVSIDGLLVRAREGDKNSYHRFYLHNKIEEYEASQFILPVSVFNEFNKVFNFYIYKTMRNINGEFVSVKPLFA